MIISMIVAASQNDVIGKDGQLPWHLPADMKYFKAVTSGHCIIMGRKTFESLGKPLPNRTNIIISRQHDFSAAGCVVVNDIRSAIDYAKNTGDAECFIIGGGDIFIQSLIWTERIYMTRIAHTFEGDTFFPKPDLTEWKLIKDERHTPDAKNKYAYSFQVYDRNYD